MNENRYHICVRVILTQVMTMKKTISFAVMHFSVAFGVAYALTGSFVIGGLLAVVEPAVNTVAFYFHERFWERASAPRFTLRADAGSATVAV